jgi:hypothetical protein
MEVLYFFFLILVVLASKASAKLTQSTLTTLPKTVIKPQMSSYFFLFDLLLSVQLFAVLENEREQIALTQNQMSLSPLQSGRRTIVAIPN